eukprot:scaffold37429_cov60-Phaeocystis_antarctica.AAC.8
MSPRAGKQRKTHGWASSDRQIPPEARPRTRVCRGQRHPQLCAVRPPAPARLACPRLQYVLVGRPRLGLDRVYTEDHAVLP